MCGGCTYIVCIGHIIIIRIMGVYLNGGRGRREKGEGGGRGVGGGEGGEGGKERYMYVTPYNQ